MTAAKLGGSLILAGRLAEIAEQAETQPVTVVAAKLRELLGVIDGVNPKGEQSADRTTSRDRVDELTARLRRIPRYAWQEALDCNDETVAFRAIAMTLLDWEVPRG